ncbi:MAG: hypothetical protein P8106_08945 [Gammaproteobacteria bacterium]|jgi:hypothetical protein
MLVKFFWVLSVVLYGAAAVLAHLGPSGGLDYRFWLLIGLGTLSAVLGNTLNRPELWEDDKRGTHAPR